MANLVNLFLDSTEFSGATAVYLDIDLLTKAPDGYYTYGSLNREQLGGFLQSGVDCSLIVDDCNLDCIVSNWSSWSECSGGTQTRTRIVIQEPTGSGTTCPVLEETQSCSGTTTAYQYFTNASATSGFVDQNNACSGGVGVYPIWTTASTINQITTGTTLYSDLNLTSVWNGDSEWYGITSVYSQTPYASYQIDNSGNVILKDICTTASTYDIYYNVSGTISGWTFDVYVNSVLVAGETGVAGQSYDGYITVNVGDEVYAIVTGYDYDTPVDILSSISASWVDSLSNTITVEDSHQGPIMPISALITFTMPPYPVDLFASSDEIFV